MTPEELYPFWRFEMWCKGYGTYLEIDEAVNNKTLRPFKIYPDKSSNNQIQPTDKVGG